MKMENRRRTATVGKGWLTLKDVSGVARGALKVRVSRDQAFLKKLAISRAALESALSSGRAVYGVNTGFGQSCNNRIGGGKTNELGENLHRYHRCGVGEPLDIPQARAALFCRMASLARGFSGVSAGLLNHMASFLNYGVTPLIPSIGSVGASGDLTPMAYVTAALAGEHRCHYRGKDVPTSRALLGAGLIPYSFGPKETLAMMNGTPVMTGLASLAVERAKVIISAAIKAAALSIHALAAHPAHFAREVMDAKFHPGQRRAGASLNSLLSGTDIPEVPSDELLQDPYSIRCTPQVLGAALDALEWIETWVERELNSVSDNPICGHSKVGLYTGGNFYGGHIALAMDALKIALAQVAEISDRRLALLVDPRSNRGLPANLVGMSGVNAAVHHGFKAMQITCSAITAEAVKNAAPAAVMSRSTECHNQDVVSMGTLAARDAVRQCWLVSKAVSIELLAAAQACEIRGRLDGRPAVGGIIRKIRMAAPPHTKDRPMDSDIAAVDDLLELL